MAAASDWLNLPLLRHHVTHDNDDGAGLYLFTDNLDQIIHISLSAHGWDGQEASAQAPPAVVMNTHSHMACLLYPVYVQYSTVQYPQLTSDQLMSSLLLSLQTALEAKCKMTSSLHLHTTFHEPPSYTSIATQVKHYTHVEQRLTKV